MSISQKFFVHKDRHAVLPKRQQNLSHLFSVNRCVSIDSLRFSTNIQFYANVRTYTNRRGTAITHEKKLKRIIA